VRLPLRAAICLAVLITGCDQIAPSYVEPPLPSKLQRDDAIALIRGLDTVGRVDRVDAKLMTFEEYVRGAGPVRTHTGDPQATPLTGFGMIGDQRRSVWAVAISGQVWPQGRVPVFFGTGPRVSPTPYPPYRWAIFLIDAVPGQLMVIGDAGIGEAWPAVFADLPNHAVAR
jgi:hypothetical protein